MNDVIAGNIQMLFSDPVTGAELAKAGKVRAIGVTSKNRVSVFPDVPPIADTVPGYEATNWHMILAPANTPADVVEKLSAEIRAIGAMPEVRQQIDKIGLEPLDSPPPETAGIPRCGHHPLGQVRGADRPRRIAVAAGVSIVADLKDIADRLIAAYDTATTLPPITAGAPDFSVADGYAVLHDIETRRRAQGWQPVGRKIGFTNRTIWPRYGVYQPMWAHVWTRTVHFATDGKASLPLQGFVQPRIEPEVVFKLKGAGAADRRSGRGACRASNGWRRDSRSCRAISRTGSSPPPIAPRRSGCMARWWSARRSP